MAKKEDRISDPVKNVNILPKKRPLEDPVDRKRHEKFQCGYNPMKMTAFEQELATNEKREREHAREKYIRGIQGVDGGSFEARDNERDMDDSWTRVK